MSTVKAFQNHDEAVKFMESITDYPVSIIGPRAGTSHPWDVIREPVVGDLVSYGFNGDWYPCGTVTRVLKTKLETSDGTVFRRNGMGFWKHNQTWSLGFGVIDERNPEF